MALDPLAIELVDSIKQYALPTGKDVSFMGLLTVVSRILERAREQGKDNHLGYVSKEIENVGKRIAQERGTWIHHFDAYVELILRENPSMAVNLIIDKAAALANARMVYLKEKFGEVVDD